MAAPGQIRKRASPTAVLVTALCLYCSLGSAAADKQPSLEYQVKAAFLLNFTKFIEWPPSALPPNAPFSICILGGDPFGGALDRIVEGETVNGRKLAVERIQRQQSHSCQIVFVDRSQKDMSKVLTGFGRGVLTVGEGIDFIRDGGMIAFVIENRRVRFDVNMPAAANVGLRISSKLLNVARSVEK
jgi:hypothetical protein